MLVVNISKRLTIKKGCKGGLQYHRLKDECGYILAGKLRIILDDGSETWKSLNQVIFFTLRLELSSGRSPRRLHHSWKLRHHANDREGWKTYGIVNSDHGLPTTKLSDVEYL